MHFTKDKGDLAVAKTILDLTEKGYYVLTPTFCEHLPFDLVAYKDNIFYRIQCKYSTEGVLEKSNSWRSKEGAWKKREYKSTDFDFYAVYIPSLEKVLYPSIEFGGLKLRIDIPKSATPFYWWEDFLLFTTKDKVKKKNFRDFGVIIEPHNKGISDCKHTDKLTLWKQVWDMPTTEVAKLYGFSDRALGKWCVALNIPKPARGFWAKYNSQKFDGQFCPLPN